MKIELYTYISLREDQKSILYSCENKVSLPLMECPECKSHFYIGPQFIICPYDGHRLTRSKMLVEQNIFDIENNKFYNFLTKVLKYGSHNDYEVIFDGSVIYLDIITTKKIAAAARKAFERPEWVSALNFLNQYGVEYTKKYKIESGDIIK